ncbi:MAG: sodium-dependent transporter [Bacteroidales bacterium]|nr:sodium-dependent transporter [Bacteroidales bacterium]
MSQQKSFSSNLGAIMAAVGSAVGLGNIWRFPYICGRYGGGAFLIVYLCFVFLLGSVLMMSEFVIGRRAQHTPVKAFQTLYPKNKAWGLVGLLGIVTSFFILSQYLVISGWTTGYVWNSISGELALLGNDAGAISAFFTQFATSQWEPVVFLSVFAAIVLLIILGGVQKGIENVSKVLMPVLVLLVLVLCVRSLTLPGAGKGVEYLFSPDFSKLTGEGVLAALGQALFSLSVGMGVMLVYGSYIPVNDNIFKTAMWITACDTLIALLAGLAIFPAVFSCGFEPTGGPGLVFLVLPNVFNMMGTPGVVFASIFFLLLMVAAITSAISLLEALTAWFCEHTGARRPVGALLFFVLTTALGILFSLSMGSLSHIKIAGLTLFDFVDRMNSIYLPPLCALGTIIFFGWVMPEEDVKDELSNHGTLRVGYYRVFRLLARYLAPLALLVVLVSGILLN